MSAPPPATTTASNNPYLEFQAGVTAALRSWSALKTAVEQSWGGPQSEAKAEDLRNNIFRFFDGSTPNPRITVDELEDNLLDYMEEEFGIVLEDNSERQLADWICKMYEGCAKGDVTLAREVVAMAMKAEKEGRLQGVKSVIQSADGDMDESDEEDDEGEDPNDSMEGGEGTAATESNNITTTTATTMQESELAMAYVSGNLFGGPPKPIKELPPPRQLGESEPEKPQPVVDDDGFAPVVSKKKKGKKI